jgi:hypothetical protein
MLHHRPEDGFAGGLLGMLVERFEAFAQGEDAIDILLHDEVLNGLLELDLHHSAVVRLGPIALAAKALAVAQQER